MDFPSGPWKTRERLCAWPSGFPSRPIGKTREGARGRRFDGGRGPKGAGRLPGSCWSRMMMMDDDDISDGCGRTLLGKGGRRG